MLALRGITKTFGPVVANQDIDLDFYAGEIHGLLGENGAGKSTLMNIVFGALRPDAGTIELDGERLEAISTRHALESGVAMVHQHFMLIPTLTVAENLLLSVRSMPAGKGLGIAGVINRMNEVGARHGIQLDPHALVDDLTVGEKLRLEILRSLLQGDLRDGLRVFILDEPTALLTRPEIVQLFATLRSLAAQGTAVVIITHKLAEISEACDRVTVLRDGRVIDTLPVAETTPGSLGRMMIGRDLPERRYHPAQVITEPLLEVEDLEVLSEHGPPLLSGISFSVRGGEILGIAGVAGNGQEVLAECITGLRPADSGRIRIGGQEIGATSRRELIERHLAHVPEDRRLNALVVDAAIEHNTLLGLHRWPRFQRRGWQQRREIVEHADEVRRNYEIRTPGIRTTVNQLSGGNQQRVVVGRELYKQPKVIVASGPTRGLDVAGIEYIHDRLIEQRDQGAAIVLISLDLDELLALSDRLFVLQGGRFRGELSHEEFDLERIGVMMGGDDGGFNPPATVTEGVSA